MSIEHFTAGFTSALGLWVTVLLVGMAYRHAVKFFR